MLPRIVQWGRAHRYSVPKEDTARITRQRRSCVLRASSARLAPLCLRCVRSAIIVQVEPRHKFHVLLATSDEKHRSTVRTHRCIHRVKPVLLGRSVSTPIDPGATNAWKDLCVWVPPTQVTRLAEKLTTAIHARRDTTAPLEAP